MSNSALLISPLLTNLWPWWQFTMLYFALVNTHNKPPLLLLSKPRIKRHTVIKALSRGNTAQQQCPLAPLCFTGGSFSDLLWPRDSSWGRVVFEKARHCCAKYTLYWTWPLICLFAVATWDNYTGGFPFNILLYSVAFTQALFPQFCHLGRYWCLPQSSAPPRWHRGKISFMLLLSSRGLKRGLMS